MNVMIRARSLPYQPELRKSERICQRCGILFNVLQPARDQHLVTCRDCRGIR